jgi:hypothetical protein
LFDIT